MKASATASAGALFLLFVYLCTLAPDVTFWDAGEFIAATHSLGIPHPPGTPLFVLVLNVWAKLLFFLPYAVATNLFSACATASAAGITGAMVQRATGSSAMGFSAAVATGGMSSVWLNATETEVYAAALLLAILTLWSAEKAGRTGEARWTQLTIYLIVLAVPLHLSALVVAPVAVLLGAYTPSGYNVSRALLLGGVFLIAVGLGRMLWPLVAVGAAIVVSVTSIASERPRGGWDRLRREVFRSMLIIGVGASALLFLYVRAQLDPAINQGNPSTFAALADVVARRQYAVSPMWPREAPLWIQLGNVAQYMDWQVALSFGPTVFPSIARSIGTVFFVVLGYFGAVELWRRNRRLGMTVLALFLCGSFGVMTYLNLHAGPSIGYGILPDTALREARERDYFFVFAFWAWGIWIGVGAALLAARVRRPVWTGALIACLPIVMNWRAVSRRGQPEQSLPRRVGEAFLESVPPRGVLFVVGDNDSYPLWYAQEVLGIRRDVTVVTVPLLPTQWYRSELARRHRLLAGKEIERYEFNLGTAAEAADGARRQGRPVVAAITLTAGERSKLGSRWTATGLTYVACSTSCVTGTPTAAPTGTTRMDIDTTQAKRWMAWVEDRVPSRAVRSEMDPVSDYFRRVLDCPRQLASHGRESAALDSVCNYR